MPSSSFYQTLSLTPVNSQYSADQIQVLIETTLPTALSEFPVYNGVGPVPVAAGQWFISNGILTQAAP